MAREEDFDRIWAIIERVGVCMLTTRGTMGLHARPVEARPDRISGVIWFLTDLCSNKEHEIAADDEIGLVFIDRDENLYLSITASAEGLRDRAVAAAIWRTPDNMWWDGPDDPNVGLLRVAPRTAELWDGPSSKAVVLFEFLKSQIAGGEPNLGENRKRTIDMG
jgi:general stress protein 26